MRREMRKVKNSRALQWPARLGFAANGLLHILIAAAAIGVATGAGAREADQSSAMKQLRSTPMGEGLLIMVALLLAALGVWQLVQILFVPRSDTTRKWGLRIKDLGMAIAYVTIAGIAVTYAFGSRASSSDSSQNFSSLMLHAPGGVFLLVLIALVVVGVGVGFVVSGLARKFTANIRVPEGAAGVVVLVLGASGYTAKGLTLVLVGALYGYAVFTTDADKAAGLDGVVKTMTELPFGSAILVLVAVGLMAYGIFCITRARTARM